MPPPLEPTDPTVSADPAAMAAFASAVVPADDNLGKVAAYQLMPAMQALAQSKCDPQFLPPSVAVDPIAFDLQKYAEWCQNVDRYPALIGQAFAEADAGVAPGVPLTASLLDAQLTKDAQSWMLDNNISASNPAEWEQVAGFAACPVVVGGFVRGPDGLKYAIVPEQLFSHPPPSNVPSISPADDPTPEDGTVWTQVGSQSGFVTVGKPVSGWLKADAIFLSATNPDLVQQDAEAVGRDVYAQTEMGPDGPEFGTPTQGPGFGYEPQPEDGPAEDPVGAGTSTIGWVDGGLAGLEWANSMDNARIWNYQISYYQGPDGSRRARLAMYRIWQTKEGEYIKEKTFGYIGNDGKIVTSEPTFTPMDG